MHCVVISKYRTALCKVSIIVWNSFYMHYSMIISHDLNGSFQFLSLWAKSLYLVQSLIKWPCVANLRRLREWNLYDPVWPWAVAVFSELFLPGPPLQGVLVFGAKSPPADENTKHFKICLNSENYHGKYFSQTNKMEHTNLLNQFSGLIVQVLI